MIFVQTKQIGHVVTGLISLIAQQQNPHTGLVTRKNSVRQVASTDRSSLVSLGVLVLLAISQGCSGAPDDQPEVAPVKGIVLVDGHPMKDLQVEFFPEQGRQSMGMTDDLGQYSLLYIRDVKGAKIGPHQVVITVMRTSLPEDKEIEPAKFELPPIYNVQSTLVADVHPGENVINFDLNTKVSK